MTAVKFVSHDENDVLLWMTAGDDAGPFDSTVNLWNHCIDRLVKAGYVERSGNALNAVVVTPAGEAKATELRAA